MGENELRAGILSGSKPRVR